MVGGTRTHAIHLPGAGVPQCVDEPEEEDEEARRRENADEVLPCDIDNVRSTKQ